MMSLVIRIHLPVVSIKVELISSVVELQMFLDLRVTRLRSANLARLSYWLTASLGPASYSRLSYGLLCCCYLYYLLRYSTIECAFADVADHVHAG